MVSLPALIQNEVELDRLLSWPPPALVAMMRRLEGDIIILGVAGKMGVTLGQMAVRAVEEAGVTKRVYGVARFNDPHMRTQLDSCGVATIACDLLDRAAVAELPRVPNVIFMAGRKFGTYGSEALTWAMNTVVPANVAAQYGGCRIVAFSTGCVYPLVQVPHGGCTEVDLPAPVGEYAQSCLGRERVFQYACQAQHSPTCLFRLNYAVDLRYGVLHDIAQQVWREEPVDVTVSFANVIWQGDANARALLALEHCAVPASLLNITGPETFSVRWAAQEFGRLMGKTVQFTGEEGPLAYLVNPATSMQLYGYPHVPLQRMVEWTAMWIASGGRSLGKPTHFTVNNGKY